MELIKSINILMAKDTESMNLMEYLLDNKLINCQHILKMKWILRNNIDWDLKELQIKMNLRLSINQQEMHSKSFLHGSGANNYLM